MESCSKEINKWRFFNSEHQENSRFQDRMVVRAVMMGNFNTILNWFATLALQLGDVIIVCYALTETNKDSWAKESFDILIARTSKALSTHCKQIITLDGFNCYLGPRCQGNKWKSWGLYYWPEGNKWEWAKTTKFMPRIWNERDKLFLQKTRVRATHMAPPYWTKCSTRLSFWGKDRNGH